MGEFLPDGLLTFKVVNEVLELTCKLSSIMWKKLLAPQGFLIRRVLVLNNRLNMQVPRC